MIDYRSLGRRISFYRKKAGMTQAILSEALGVTESYISQIERGSAKVSLSRLSEISDILQVDIALLVSEKSIVSEQVVNTEISEIIKDWSNDQISLLVELLYCANKNFGRPEK